MRIFTAAGLWIALLAAGCGAHSPEPESEPSPSSYVGPIVGYPSEDAFSGASNGAGPAADALENAAGFVPIAGDPYSCTSGVKLTVSVTSGTNGAGTARLTIAGTTVELSNAGAASPDRFTTPSPTADGQRLTWWSQGGDGLLIESPWGDSSSASETRVSCRRDA